MSTHPQTSASEDVKQRQHFHIAVTMEESMDVSQNIKIELTCSTVILLLDVYPKKSKTLIWKDTCIPMFIVALFAIAKEDKEVT